VEQAVLEILVTTRVSAMPVKAPTVVTSAVARTVEETPLTMVATQVVRPVEALETQEATPASAVQARARTGATSVGERKAGVTLLMVAVEAATAMRAMVGTAGTAVPVTAVAMQEEAVGKVAVAAVADVS
jgi:hypothetical protein